MRNSQEITAKIYRTPQSAVVLIVCLTLALCCVAKAQQSKGGAKSDLTGRYEGTAKNKAEEVITVALNLTDKEGALSGTIESSHGNFPIADGTHQGETVTIEFEAGGTNGTISLRTTQDKLVGTWSAGEDGGPLDVKKVAARENGR